MAAYITHLNTHANPRKCNNARVSVNAQCLTRPDPTLASHLLGASAASTKSRTSAAQCGCCRDGYAGRIWVAAWLRARVGVVAAGVVQHKSGRSAACAKVCGISLGGGACAASMPARDRSPCAPGRGWLDATRDPRPPKQSRRYLT